MTCICRQCRGLRLQRRFGLDIFENGEPNPRLIPMDLPVGPDYVVGPGDSLNVDLWGSVSRRITRVVDREGRLTLPEVGPVLVSGKSMADAQQLIQQQVCERSFVTFPPTYRCLGCVRFASTTLATCRIPVHTTSVRYQLL